MDWSVYETTCTVVPSFESIHCSGLFVAHYQTCFSTFQAFGFMFSQGHKALFSILLIAPTARPIICFHQTTIARPETLYG